MGKQKEKQFIKQKLYYAGHTSFYCASQIPFFKIKVCGKHESNNSIRDIFPTAFVHFVSLCHTLLICAVFQRSFCLFHLFLSQYYAFFLFPDLLYWLKLFTVGVVKVDIIVLFLILGGEYSFLPLSVIFSYKFFIVNFQHMEEVPICSSVLKVTIMNGC